MIGGYRDLPSQSLDAVTPLRLDLLDRGSIVQFVETALPDCVIHSAAMTDVDHCEQRPELALSINATGVESLVKALGGSGCRLILLSTDYVFNGKDGPYDEGAVPKPINVYGGTKLAAEEIVQTVARSSTIIRSASFLGIGSPNRPTWAEKLVATMLERPPVPAATDQRSNITPVGFLADAIVEVVETGQTGLLHIAGDAILSRHEFAQKLARLFDLRSEVVRAVQYRDLNRPAPRPLNGGLISRHTLSTVQVPLDVALARWKTEYSQSW